MTPKERGILMRGEMVLALLNNAIDSWPAEALDPAKPFKWQSRRPVKGIQHTVIKSSDNGKWYDADCINPGRELICPYGKKGDILWVKETFGIHKAQQGARITSLGPGWICYRADKFGCPETLVNSWEPSIFMSKRISRIRLQLMEEPTIERVNDITDEDAKAEGVTLNHSLKTYDKGEAHRFEFRMLYDSIHGKIPSAFLKGSWVWKLVFKRIL